MTGDAVSALVNLGYGRSEALGAVAEASRKLGAEAPLSALIKEGLKAVKILAGEGIKSNVTLCFSAVQALMAAKAGAAYISPFVGRLDGTSLQQAQKLALDWRHKTGIPARGKNGSNVTKQTK